MRNKINSYTTKNIILILILVLLILSPQVCKYIKNNHKVYLWLYFQTSYGYFNQLYYYKVTSPVNGFYNAYYLNSFSIRNPRVCKLINDTEFRLYVFSDSILHKCIEDPKNFIKRQDVFEIAPYNSVENIRCELYNWKKVTNSTKSLVNEFYSRYSLDPKYKNDTVEVYKFLINPKGFICILQQDPIYKINDDVVNTIGYQDNFRAYVLPYFSYKNLLKYNELVEEKFMNKEKTANE